MPSLLRVVVCAAALGVALPLLSGCAPDRDQFAPACPRVAFVTPTADLAIYRPGSNGRDLSALLLAGRLQAVGGKCQAGKQKDTVEATVTVGAELSRGPAMRGNVADVPIYVAVTEGSRILDKRIYVLRAVFPPNVDQVAVATPPVFMVLPVSVTKSAAAYSILTGFQLTPAQLAASRGQ